MTIRDYQTTDYDQLQSLWEITRMGGKFRGDNKEIIENTIKSGGKLIVLLQDDKLIGSSWITNDARRLYLHHFGILPAYQGRGFSKMLLDESLKFARKTGLQIKLEVHKNNEIALKLYKKEGFKYLGDYLVYIIREYDQIQY
ncbi:MAG: GNAT family N-acetyltransferase [Bacteroidetes bacterium]|nr:GNAT family N-acetyltransferase [Bacteroidota bacterium]MBL6962762.1 GNAT family N-acetyltransferase [Bacteroidota bacterium]